MPSLSLWRRLTRWYAELLSWLLVLTVGILVIPVSLQIFSRYTALIPAYIWTEEMARFLPGLEDRRLQIGREALEDL